MGNHEPVLQVVRGTPTAEELAALVGAVCSLARGPSPATPPSRWMRSARPAAAGALSAERGPRAWRASALPR